MLAAGSALTANEDAGPDGEAPLGLEAIAAISAAISEGDRPRDEVLRAHGLTPSAWDAIEARHNQRIALDAIENDPPALADAYAAAFVRAQDAIKPVPALRPEEWAALSHDVASKGDAALDARGLRKADFLRLSRHWARELAASPALARRYFAACYALDKQRSSG